MIVDFATEELRAFLLHGEATARPYLKWLSNRELLEAIKDVMNVFEAVDNCKQLAFYRRLSYEKLRHERNGQSSVRLGYKTKFRLIFEEFENGIRINVLEISEHYGDK